jgi:hypothetical protein
MKKTDWAMSYEMLKTLKEANEEVNRRIYTIPKPGERWRASQIEGMALFTLSLHLTYDWYQAITCAHVSGHRPLGRSSPLRAGWTKSLTNAPTQSFRRPHNDS